LEGKSTCDACLCCVPVNEQELEGKSTCDACLCCVPVNKQELEGKSTYELVESLSQVDNMYYQAEILQALLNREGLYFQVAGETVEEKLEKLAQKCGSLQVWYVTDTFS